MTRYAKMLGRQISRVKRKGRFASMVERGVPPLYLILVVVADHLIPSSTVTPSLCLLGLMGMAFFLRPQWMLLWGSVYWLLVAGIFFNPHVHQYLNHEALQSHPWTPSSFTRTLTFGIAAGFCTLFSLTLSRFRKSHDEILEILSRFPRPIITSNLEGRILYLNDAARNRFSLHGPYTADISYFDLLAPKAKKGLLISRYLQQIDYRDSGELTLEFNGETLSAETILLDSTGEKILVTAITE